MCDRQKGLVWKRHGCKRTKGRKGDSARCFLSHVMLSPCLAPLTDRFPFPAPWTLRADLGEREIYPRRRGRETGFNQRIWAVGSIYMQKRNTPSSINDSTIHFVRNTTDKQKSGEMIFFFRAVDHADDKRGRSVLRSLFFLILNLRGN